MPLRIISADERLAETAEKTTFAIFGPPAIGKTTLVTHLDPDSTLFLNIEAGMKAIQGWRGRSIDLRTYSDAMDLFCLIGGVDPAAGPNDFFSAGHHKQVADTYGNAIDLSTVRSIFVDSITDLARLAMTWAKERPEARSPTTGAPDLRGAYGLLGREVVRALKHLQHARAKNTILVGGLERQEDDAHRVEHVAQMEGGKIGRELPFIVDQVITYDLFDYSEATGAPAWFHSPGKGEHRVFVCRKPNPWNLPAKDRSGRLDMIEQPHLGRLLEKINGPARAGSGVSA